MKKICLIALAIVAIGSIFILLNSQKENRKIPILVYHHFVKADWDGKNFAIMTEEKFRNDMLYLKNQGYNTISFDQLLSCYEDKTPLPEKPIMITFDDGYRSNYEIAFPILKELDLKAAIFVIGKTVGNTELTYPHFDWAQAREMTNSGLISIQSHTFDLHNIDESGVSKLEGETDEQYKQRLYSDFTLINKLIEENTHVKPIALSYPNTIYNSTSEEIAKKAGYKITLNEHGRKADISKGLYSLTKFGIGMETKLQDILK